MTDKNKQKLTREEKIAKRERRREEHKNKKRFSAPNAEAHILTPHEKSILAKKREKRITFWARVALTLLLYTSLLLLLGFCIFVGIWTTKRLDNTIVTSRITVEDETKNERLRVITNNSTPYISISFLERYGEIIHSGDYSARTIHFTDTGDSATFVVNSSFCTINGVDINLNNPVLLRDGELYLPLDFYQTYVTGINVTVNGEKYEINSLVNNLGYKIKPAFTTNKIPEAAAGALLEFATQTPVFLSDLSAYERYMHPGETTEFLTLVNLNNGISETFRPNDLTGVEDQNAAYPGGDYHAKLRLFAAKSLDAMIQEARANGYLGLQATSGYRSYAEQRYRFTTLVNSIMSTSGVSQAVAEAEAAKSVQKPGYSEYQTGLCADVRFPNDPIDTFKDTDAAKWLAENCYKFGFVLRYPETKSDSTGMEYQSWHFRYVGRYHAVRMTFLDMSLEEYHIFMGLDPNKIA